MTNATTTASVHAHPLLKLLGARDGEFSYSQGKLYLITDRYGAEEVNMESLCDPHMLRNKFVFSEIHIDTVNGERRLTHLFKKEAASALCWLHRQFAIHMAPTIAEDAGHIRRILAAGYLRKSRADAIKSVAKRYAPILSTELDLQNLDNSIIDDLGQLRSMRDLNPMQVADIRTAYVVAQEQEHTELFDTIEDNPLTASQRQACIIDEDNNLVLAGAGTGKTSTMIGRAGYLIRSGQAKPQEILMLAFANKAADEMQERLDERLGDTGIVATTFHKLGKNIIAQVEGAQPTVANIATDDELLKKTVDDWFAIHMEDANYQKKMLKYFEEFLYPSMNPFDFQTEGEYFDYIIANEIRTLKGEVVKGIGECLIANHLFKLGIQYKYEAQYEIPTRDTNYSQYQPDFYLPDYKIYIEHFGVDRQGNTAPYVDREKYQQGMRWKRELHKENDTTLLETYFYEHIEGCLLEHLEKKLREHNVCIEPIPNDAVLATLKEFGAVTSFSGLLSQLLRLFKANHFDDAELDNVIRSSADPKQVRAALDLLRPIYDNYQEQLASNQQIDFDDMIGKAQNYVAGGQFRSRWKYIMVDEFQDISAPRARLVMALRDAVEDCSLFCVGDDWQAIYRFTGSDIRYTSSFEETFGVTHISALDKTFRFNNSISEISSKFIQKNPDQLKKNLSTHTRVDSPAVSLLRENPNLSGHNGRDLRLDKALAKIATIASAGSNVYILSRFSFGLPSQQHIRRLKNQYPGLKIASYTMHASKGKEADYVILTGLDKGKFGLPSQKVTHPLLEALLPSAESFPYAEERRIFYVAITRARKRAYLICDMATASEFVTELLKDKYPIELDEFETSLTQKFFQLINCSRCDTGTMVAKTSKFGLFYGCSHYPLCDNTENGCDSCDSPMEKKGRFKVCINPDCDSWRPLCPRCGANMVERRGKHGSFWGCRNYRPNQQNSCSHTESEIAYSRKASKLHTH